MNRSRLPAAVLVVFVLSACSALSSQQPDASAVLRQHIRAGLEAQKANRLDEAATEFETVIRLAPKLAQAYMSLGFVRHDQHRYSEAIPLLEKALELRPEIKDVHAFLGFDYLQTGQLVKSVEQLEKATESMYNAINALGEVAGDNSDRGVIAVLNEYGYRPLKKEFEAAEKTK